MTREEATNMLKALEQQPCEDTISRQAAIDAIMGEPTDAHYPSWYAERLEQLPSAQPEQRWIPCSERLPDDPGDYLVSIKRIGWNTKEYVENDIAYWDDLEGFHKADEVLAWMPLPEPYEGDENE